MRNLRLDKWLLIQAIDIILVAVSTPLAFYIALQFDKEGFSPAFLLLLILLSLLGAINAVISWIAWIKLKDALY